MQKLKTKIQPEKIILIIFYSTIYAIGLHFFMQPSNLITTGLAGIAQIIDHFTPLSYGVVYIIINIPGIILGITFLGKRFTVYSVLNIFTVSIFTSVFDKVKFHNDLDPLINAIFGGILIGYALGKLLKMGASSGGTDFYAMYLLKYKNIDFQSVNFITNLLIIAGGVLTFSLELGVSAGITVGLYTIISLYVRNSVLESTFTNAQTVTLFIVGKNLDDVSDYINNTLHRGTTIINEVQGGYTHENKQMIMATLNKYEYSIFIENIFYINPEVFINIVDTNQIVGNYKKDKGSVDEVHGDK